jgi:hypothetical protein
MRNLVEHAGLVFRSLAVGNGRPINAYNFTGLDLLQRGSDDVPCIITGVIPDALDKANAVKLTWFNV